MPLESTKKLRKEQSSKAILGIATRSSKSKGGLTLSIKKPCLKQLHPAFSSELSKSYEKSRRRDTKGKPNKEKGDPTGNIPISRSSPPENCKCFESSLNKGQQGHRNKDTVQDKHHEDSHRAGNMIEANVLADVTGTKRHIIHRYVCGDGSTDSVTGLQLEDEVIYVSFFRAGGYETFLSAHRLGGAVPQLVVPPNSADETLLENGYSYLGAIEFRPALLSPQVEQLPSSGPHALLERVQRRGALLVCSYETIQVYNWLRENKGVSLTISIFWNGSISLEVSTFHTAVSVPWRHKKSTGTEVVNVLLNAVHFGLGMDKVKELISELEKSSGMEWLRVVNGEERNMDYATRVQKCQEWVSKKRLGIHFKPFSKRLKNEMKKNAALFFNTMSTEHVVILELGGVPNRIVAISPKDGILIDGLEPNELILCFPLMELLMKKNQTRSEAMNAWFLCPK